MKYYDCTNPRLSIIAAQSTNGVIGKDGKLPWKCSSDLDIFKRYTLYKPLIMGRKTWDSLPGSLKDRNHIVVTSNPENYNWRKTTYIHFVSSFEEAVKITNQPNYSYVSIIKPEIFIIGGQSLYEQTINKVDRIYLTTIDKDFDGDTFFPYFNRENFKIQKQLNWLDKKSNLPCYFEVLQRKLDL